MFVSIETRKKVSFAQTWDWQTALHCGAAFDQWSSPQPWPIFDSNSWLPVEVLREKEREKIRRKTVTKGGNR
jgi:hypothetical protein